MYRTARRAALSPLSGIQIVRPPRGGWHRSDPADGGDGSSGHSNAGSGGSNDGGTGGSDGDVDGKAGDKTPTITGDFDADRAKRAISAARDAEKKAKDDAKAARDQVAALLRAAGLTPDGKADPEAQVKALTDRAEAAEKRANALATRDAVRSAAAANNADAELLLDSQKFLGQLAELDPTSTDFADKVADAVKATVKNNPRYATTPAAKGGAGKSGSADHTGGGTGRERPKGLGAAIAARMQK